MCRGGDGGYVLGGREREEEHLSSHQLEKELGIPSLGETSQWGMNCLENPATMAQRGSRNLVCSILLEGMRHVLRTSWEGSAEWRLLAVTQTLNFLDLFDIPSLLQPLLQHS